MTDPILYPIASSWHGRRASIPCHAPCQEPGWTRHWCGAVGTPVSGSMFGWLVADGWCWFVLREEYCWLVTDGWFVVREKHCWLVCRVGASRSRLAEAATAARHLGLGPRLLVAFFNPHPAAVGNRERHRHARAPMRNSNLRCSSVRASSGVAVKKGRGSALDFFFYGDLLTAPRARETVSGDGWPVTGR
jgi:hypothetical protein